MARGAGFLINARGTLVALDPALSHAPGPEDRAEFGLRLLVPLPIEATAVPRLDLVCISHPDPDHLAPLTIRELTRPGAAFAEPGPVADRLRALRVAAGRLRAVRSGDRFRVGEVEVRATRAEHAWQVQDPARYGPPFGPDDCCGFLVRTPDGTIWHPGDTVLLDEHLRVDGVDVLLLDISRDPFHLGPASAARLADALESPRVIPHHHGCYDDPAFAAVNGDPAEVAALLRDAAHRRRVLAPGERFDLGAEAWRGGAPSPGSKDAG